MRDLWDYTTLVIWHYWLWVVLAAIPRFLSFIGWLHPPFKRWLDGKPLMEKRWVAITVLLAGFFIANYMAFHDAKNETRALQQKFERYKQAHTISMEGLKKHIFLTERYGGEWQGTNDAQIVFWRREGRRDVLQKPYNPNLPEDPTQWPRLTPFLVHQIFGFITPNATLYLKIPKRIDVKVLPGHIEPSPNYKWTPGASDSKWNHYYTTMPAGATEKIGSGVIQSLALKFPEPGTYPIEYILSFPIMGWGDMTGTFYLEIFGEN
ncbi:MAG: hypothetical protein Q8R91_04705 [Candidatus Omnitrophota bacterium]|nr:hypothetical protein [Candidatus Omnitrophota bacterium]